MRLARIKATEGHVGVYHCMSRIVGGQHLLDDVCKEKSLLFNPRVVARVDPIAGEQGASHAKTSGTGAHVISDRLEVYHTRRQQPNAGETSPIGWS